MTQKFKEVLTLAEAAEYVGLSVQTFKRIVYKDKFVLPVFDRADLDRFNNDRRDRRTRRTTENPTIKRIRALESELTELKRRVDKLERPRTEPTQMTFKHRGTHEINIDDLPE